MNVSFCIWDFEDISPEQLTEIIGLQPVKTYIKGQTKSTNPNFHGYLAKESGWIIDSGCSEDSSFEEHMNALCVILESKLEVLKSICQKYSCEIKCTPTVYSGTEESTPSIHLDQRYNNLVKELNIEFDLDLYCYDGK